MLLASVGVGGPGGRGRFFSEITVTSMLLCVPTFLSAESFEWRYLASSKSLIQSVSFTLPEILAKRLPRLRFLVRQFNFAVLLREAMVDGSKHLCHHILMDKLRHQTMTMLRQARRLPQQPGSVNIETELYAE